MQIKRTLLMGLIFGMFASMCASSAQAGFIDDVPDGLAETLELSRTTAELVLASGILLSVALVLAVTSTKDTNPMLIVVVLIGFVGMLTAIQWLDPWFLIMICMIIAFLYAGALRDWAQSKSPG